MKKIGLILLVAALFSVCTSGCRKKAVKEQKEKVVRVGTMKPVHKLFQQRIPVQGTVAPVRYATLSSKTSGTLDILEAAEGKLMKKNSLFIPYFIMEMTILRTVSLICLLNKRN